MAEVPPEMMTKERQPDPVFRDREVLYRRFRPEDLDGSEVVPEAFQIPDMSVNRQKYGPSRWLLLEGGFEAWGVAAFYVEDIPRDIDQIHMGVIIYVLRPEHIPLKYNYPHSEVRIYRDECRICRDNNNVDLLDPAFHIRWRERLSQLAWVIIQPRADE